MLLLAFCIVEDPLVLEVSMEGCGVLGSKEADMVESLVQGRQLAPGEKGTFERRT